MKDISSLKFLTLIGVSSLGLFGQNEAHAQSKNIPYSYQVSQKMNDVLYTPSTRLHTAVKPFIFKDDLLIRLDSIQSNQPMASDNWFVRKIFNEHLIQLEKEDYSFYADFLPDMTIGKDMMGDKRNTWMNSRGFQLGLNIGEKFTFYTSAFENQAVFPKYLDDYINDSKVVTGEGTTKFQSSDKKDWMYARASMTYDFNPYIQATVAYDKNFIGDGYRSLLLSDFSSNYSHVKLTGTAGDVQYTSVLAYMNDPKYKRVDDLGNTQRYGDGKKWGAFQYVDYNPTNRFSIGLFHGVTWANYNRVVSVDGHPPIDSNVKASPDNMLFGLNAKYKVLQNVTAYSQYVLGGGSGHQKSGAQFGLRGYTIFGVKNLNFLAEYNTVKPYTYANADSKANYSNNAEPLAHPLGANFTELVGLLNYAWKRFDFSAQMNYSKKGLDSANGANYGGDIFKSYVTYPAQVDNRTGQGIQSKVVYADAKAAYVLNPKYNLRFELGYTQRYQKISSEVPLTNKTGMYTIGLRSSFRSLYSDF